VGHKNCIKYRISFEKMSEDGNEFRPVPAELPGDNEVSPAGETCALRTNRIWGKGRVEYASLAGNSVSSVLSVAKKTA
jgi:hypothetical protein